MAKAKSAMEPQVARDYLESVAASTLGKTCLTQMGLGIVIENPLGGDDETTVDIAMKLSLQIYRQFKPRSRRGLSWGDSGDSDNGLASAGEAVGGEPKGHRKGSRKG